MPSKMQLDKAAWQWVTEVDDPVNVTKAHIDMAYRCNLQQCLRGECRRNCRGNPFCLNALGEKRWFEELDKSRWSDFDPESERRPEGHFVGLKNLGATCYVNTFLQLMFHNASVRNAIYRWREPEMPSVTDSCWKPKSICGHLQLIFGLLKYSKRLYVDPAPLIEALGLDAHEQQDAQEFSKLFLSVLEGALSSKQCGPRSNIIQEQFSGIYCYITRCQKCGSKSSCRATFYELDISICGHSSLNAALQDFLKEEKLEGENQYMCNMCNSKQNAVRSIHLQTLPPVLNLQLLRFVFDVKKGQKKKLNTYLQFGDILDMSKYLHQPDGTTVYELSAVLVHRGPSAYSGHYVAHIQDSASKFWYRFNDEDIMCMKGRKLELGKEEEITAGDLPDNLSEKTEKTPKGGKGLHWSRNAYMLVYKKIKEKMENCTSSMENQLLSEEVEDDTAAELPEAVMDYIQQDNDAFEDWVKDIIRTRDANIVTGEKQQLRVRELYSGLFCNVRNEPYDWFPTDWIIKWLADPDKADTINCSQYLCRHQKLHPDMVSRMKAVSTDGASELYKTFGGGPRLNGPRAMCEECVQLRCQQLKFRLLLTEDGKFFHSALKQLTKSRMMYWVGKASLRSWKRLALARLEPFCSLMDNSGIENGEKDGDRLLDCDQETGQEERNEGDGGVSDGAVDDGDITGAFNSEIVCEEHGELVPDQNCRRLVTDSVWSRLRFYFPDCPQFDQNAHICAQCQIKIKLEREVQDTSVLLYSQLKNDLHMLYLGRNRPRPPKLNGQRVFAVSSEFVEEWRKFVRTRDTMRREPLEEICNVHLLCEHDKLLFPVDSANSDGDNGLVLLWEEEWKMLTEHYRYDIPIEVMTLEEDGNTATVTIPETCDQCVAQRLQMEEEQKFSFEQAIIFVRRVLPNADASMNIDSEPTKEDDDPDFQEVKYQGDAEPSAAKKQKIEDTTLRKSQRHRKQRGEKEIRISSTMTLKEFKIKVMNQFSIATFDQLLTLDGRPITDSEATLGQLRFYPGCVVLVKADQPSQDTLSVMDDILSARKPEEGFKGTNLLSR